MPNRAENGRVRRRLPQRGSGLPSSQHRTRSDQRGPSRLLTVSRVGMRRLYTAAERSIRAGLAHGARAGLAPTVLTLPSGLAPQGRQQLHHVGQPRPQLQRLLERRDSTLEVPVDSVRMSKGVVRPPVLWLHRGSPFEILQTVSIALHGDGISVLGIDVDALVPL